MEITLRNPAAALKARGRRRLLLFRYCVLGGWLSASLAIAAPLGLPPLPVPADNPQTPAKIDLGRKLFHDQRFSSTGQVACMSCHLDAIAFQDGRPVPRGVNMAHGTRNAPTAINAAYLQLLFWDGRAQSLEQQALQPLFNHVEHGLRSEEELLSVIRGDAQYPALFRTAFGITPQAITPTHFAKAVAAYERSLIAGDSAFDRWYYGGEKLALSASAQRGFAVFTGAGHCVACHSIGAREALFTDQSFHNANVGFWRLGADAQRIADTYLQAQTGAVDHLVLSDQQISELGRFAVTRRREDIGAFKTPSLRNIARTAPYLHDGSLVSLPEVVDYFDRGGQLRANAAANPFQSPLIRPLHLSEQQKQDLVAFLESLTSPQYAKSP